MDDFKIGDVVRILFEGYICDERADHAQIYSEKRDAINARLRATTSLREVRARALGTIVADGESPWHDDNGKGAPLYDVFRVMLHDYPNAGPIGVTSIHLEPLSPLEQLARCDYEL